MVKRMTQPLARSRVLNRLQRSPVVADRIPVHLRVLDVALTLAVLPLVMVIGAVVALMVLVDSPGPVFYRATRIGRGGRPFVMLKFRTMRHGAVGPSLSTKGDERYTPFGRSLAASRLDELPQVLNVLKGDMRLVGPRPEVLEFVETFPEEYEQILSVPPGLTGPSQLDSAMERHVLARAEDRIDYYRTHLLPRKVEVDVDYARRHSALRDLRILLLTPLLPLFQIVSALRHAAERHHGVGHTRRLAVRALPAVFLLIATLSFASLLVADATSPF
jgi:lipopolysaccharide/colanic/teichoic acid biosynthesis glycosyltransferase